MKAVQLFAVLTVTVVITISNSVLGKVQNLVRFTPTVSNHHTHICGDFLVCLCTVTARNLLSMDEFTTV